MKTVTARLDTLADLLAMPDRKDYELLGGRLVEHRASMLSSWIGGETFGLLAAHVDRRELGTIWPYGLGIRCFRGSPDSLLRPSVCFVGRERFTLGQFSEDFLRIAPDLVVTINSPNDLARDVERKVKEYLDAGVRLVWVVDPDTRTVRVHRGDGSAAWLRQDDELSGEDVVPGFLCRVRDLFPPDAEPAA